MFILNFGTYIRNILPFLLSFLWALILCKHIHSLKVLRWLTYKALLLHTIELFLDEFQFTGCPLTGLTRIICGRFSKVKVWVCMWILLTFRFEFYSSLAWNWISMFIGFTLSLRLGLKVQAVFSEIDIFYRFWSWLTSFVCFYSAILDQITKLL